MSLYNALFGYNPFAGVFLEALGVTPDDIPRFRDCFLSEDRSEIIIHTRTGGGNREGYEKGGEYWEEGQIDNDTLRAIPGFKYDEDDNFDSTYADFHYDVPEAFKPMIDTLADLGGTNDPAARWQSLLDGMKNGDTNDPTVKRALEVGERIMGQINSALATKTNE